MIRTTLGVGPFRCLLALTACYIIVLSSIHETKLLSLHLLPQSDSSRPSHVRRRGLAVLSTQHTKNEQVVPIRRQSEKHRLAILLPYLGLDIPPYLSLFCMGAAGASSVADFVVPHNGILSEWPGRHECPSNVIFIDLETTDNMVDLMVSRMLNQKPEEKWAIPRKRLVALVSRHLESKPYSMVEYKAALGHIYQDFIPTSKYSHWAYSDFDMLFGDLERHISRDEWEDFDLTTYGYGDQDRLFVRGQFTMHRNDPIVVNQLWRPCTYMSEVDVRFHGVANGEKYRFESGEGCYSVAILQNTDIAVKYAVRAWSDAQNIQSIYDQGIVLTRSPNSPGRHVLVRVNEKGIHKENETGEKTPLLSPNWFEYDEVYQDYTMDLQKPTTDLLPLEADEVTDDCRLGWIQPEYRQKICVPPSAPVTNQTNLFWIRGKRYMQHFQWRNFVDTPYHETAPYFHFMRLKRNFRENQFAPVLDPTLSSILLAPQGGIPLIGPMDNKTASTADGNDVTEEIQTESSGRLPSPLGVGMDQWSACISQSNCSIRDLLPQASYCFSGLSLPKRKYGIKCSDVLSWQDPNRVEIVSKGPEWGTVAIDSDVTLALTLQIEVAAHRDSLSQWIDLVFDNLRHWAGAPSVVLIHLSVGLGATREKSMKALRDAFSGNPITKKTLVAVVLSEHGASVSRKALLNMAIDAAPTRWYISGLEVERGLVLSTSTRERANQSIQSVMTNTDRADSHVFFVPQFGLESSLLSTNVSMASLVEARQKNLVAPPWDFDKTCNRDLNSTFVRTADTPYEQWWGHDFLRTLFTLGSMDSIDDSYKKLLADLDRLYDFEESPILLVDNQGPRSGVLTHHLVREVEEFAGRRCFNGLRVAQLAGFGYKFSVLEGAFAVSTPSTREVSLFANDPSFPGYWKCEGCFLFNRNGPDMIEMRDEIALSEMTRPAKTLMLWENADALLF